MHRGPVRILTAGSVQMLRDLLGRQSCHGAINAVELYRLTRVDAAGEPSNAPLLPRSEEFFDCAAYPPEGSGTAAYRSPWVGSRAGDTRERYGAVRMRYGERYVRHVQRKSRRNQPLKRARRSPVGLNLDPPGGEQVSHRRLKIGLPQAVLYGLGFLGERHRRIIVGGARVADVPPLPVEPLQQLHEDLLHLFLSGQLFGVGGPQLRQEQAVLVPERDAGPERAVLVLLEFEQAQAVIGLRSLGADLLAAGP